MQLTPVKKDQFIKDLREKDLVSSPFLIKFSAIAVGKSGKPYMNLVLMDKTGECEARIWDDPVRFAGHAIQDSFAMVQGKCQAYQGRKQIVISELQMLREDEVTIDDYTLPSLVNPKTLYTQLCEYIESMEDPHYKALAKNILVHDAEIVEKLKIAPAAKSVHHAYASGLLEHIVSITGILDSLSKHYAPRLNRDLLFLGGFLHDIGKIWELSYGRITDYTDEGRLLGHLIMGIELVEKKCATIEGFPNEKKLLVKHLIASHHGHYEYGSPKRPKFLEAIIVHAIDDLDSKINLIQHFVEQDQTPGRWTSLHRQLNRYLFKGFEES